jgi:hypothetical protein
MTTALASASCSSSSAIVALNGCRLSLLSTVPVLIPKDFHASEPLEYCFIECSLSLMSAALVGLTLAELHGGSGHVARLIRGEAAFADRRHCSLISREDRIPGREGGTIIIIIIMMNTFRLSRCHQEPGLVAANKSLFKRARCVSVMVRA